MRALSWGGFGFGYVCCYLLSTALGAPVVWYFPVEHRFVMSVHPEGLAADFYGRVALCLAAGAVGYVLATVAGRWVPAPRRGWWATTVGVWCLSVAALTAGLYVYLLIGRHAAPAPLPPHYVPR